MIVCVGGGVGGCVGGGGGGIKGEGALAVVDAVENVAVTDFSVNLRQRYVLTAHINVDAVVVTAPPPMQHIVPVSGARRHLRKKPKCMSGLFAGGSRFGAVP